MGKMRSKYGEITRQTIQELADVVGKENIFTDKHQIEGYACDEMPLASPHLPQVVVKPADTRSVARLLGFADRKPDLQEIEHIWSTFRADPQLLGLPSAPERPIVFRPENNRPQPRFDRDTGNGMAVTVGRLRTCPLLDIRFVGLHHNTVRDAAGGCVLTAEMLKVKGWLD